MKSEIMEIRFSWNDNGSAGKNLPLSELARVLVRFDHITGFIVNANHWTVSFITG